MNRLLPLLLILSLLAGCGNRTTETAEVYRVVAPSTRRGDAAHFEEIGGGERQLPGNSAYGSATAQHYPPSL
jgi:hypothetical protein